MSLRNTFESIHWSCQTSLSCCWNKFGQLNYILYNDSWRFQQRSRCSTSLSSRDLLLWFRTNWKGVFLPNGMLVVCVLSSKPLPAGLAEEAQPTLCFVTTAHIPQAKLLTTLLTAILLTPVNCVIVLKRKRIEQPLIKYGQGQFSQTVHHQTSVTYSTFYTLLILTCFSWPSLGNGLPFALHLGQPSTGQ